LPIVSKDTKSKKKPKKTIIGGWAEESPPSNIVKADGGRPPEKTTEFDFPTLGEVTKPAKKVPVKAPVTKNPIQEEKQVKLPQQKEEEKPKQQQLPKKVQEQEERPKEQPKVESKAPNETPAVTIDDFPALGGLSSGLSLKKRKFYA